MPPHIGGLEPVILVALRVAPVDTAGWYHLAWMKPLLWINHDLVVPVAGNVRRRHGDG